ncbi:MAG: hypothetical protein JRN52_12810 [Nitrososphaerota archaeon]|nr:hypothetical protein [Nitrososphaerota archaeon]
MRRTTKYFFIGMTLVIAYVLIFFSVSYVINATENQIETIYVPQVNDLPNFSNPGGESFWSSVGTYHIALIQSYSYPGSPSGDTSWVNVQMAWTKAAGIPELMIRMVFPSYGAVSPTAPKSSVPILNDTTYNKFFPMYNSSCIYPTSSCFGGLYPQDVGFMPLAQGSQYVYPEQAIVMLGMTPGANSDAWYAVSYKPKMVLGTTGALGTGSGGAAEMWIWSRSPTDNSSSDPYYPGITYPNGTTVNSASFGVPSHVSYAIDGYANASSFYQIGGMPDSSTFPYINTPQFYTNNLSSITDYTPAMNPFEVQAKGTAPSNGGNWVVEFVRPLTTPSANGENRYQLQMNTSSIQSYHIAFAVSQEAASQTYLIYYNSVSFWYMFNFQTSSGFNGYSHEYGAITNGAGFAVGSLLILFLGISLVARKLEYTETIKFNLPL